MLFETVDLDAVDLRECLRMSMAAFSYLVAYNAAETIGWVTAVVTP